MSAIAELPMPNTYIKLMLNASPESARVLAVGKPLFIWFSTKDGSIGNGIHWNRIFTSAYKMD
jgi:hypothetical protein